MKKDFQELRKDLENQINLYHSKKRGNESIFMKKEVQELRAENFQFRL